MSVPRAHIILGRIEPSSGRLRAWRRVPECHPALIEYFVDSGLIEPMARMGTQWLLIRPALRGCA